VSASHKKVLTSVLGCHDRMVDSSLLCDSLGMKSATSLAISGWRIRLASSRLRVPIQLVRRSRSYPDSGFGSRGRSIRRTASLSQRRSCLFVFPLEARDQLIGRYNLVRRCRALAPSPQISFRPLAWALSPPRRIVLSSSSRLRCGIFVGILPAARRRLQELAVHAVKRFE